MNIVNNRTLAAANTAFEYDPLTNSTDIEWLQNTYVFPALVAAHGANWRNTTTEWERAVTLRKRASAFTSIAGSSPYIAQGLASVRNNIEWANTHSVTPDGNGNYTGYWFCTTFNQVLSAMLLCIGIVPRQWSLTDAYWETLAGDDTLEFWSNDFGKWAMMHGDFNCWVHNGNFIPMSVLEIYAAARNSAIEVIPEYDGGDIPYNIRAYRPTWGWSFLTWNPYGTEGMEEFIPTPTPYPDINPVTGVVGATKLYSGVSAWLSGMVFDAVNGGYPPARGSKSFGAPGIYHQYESGPYEPDPTYFSANINSIHVALSGNSVALTHNLPAVQFGEYQRRWVYSDTSKSAWGAVEASHTLTPPANSTGAEYRAVNLLGEGGGHVVTVTDFTPASIPGSVTLYQGGQRLELYLDGQPVTLMEVQ